MIDPYAYCPEVYEVVAPLLDAMRAPETPTATRWAANHDWSRRGDNTKPKNKR